MQSAVYYNATGFFLSADGEDAAVPAQLKQVVGMLKIEAEREAFLDTPIDARKPSKYSGHIESLKGGGGAVVRI